MTLRPIQLIVLLIVVFLIGIGLIVFFRGSQPRTINQNLAPVVGEEAASGTRATPVVDKGPINVGKSASYRGLEFFIDTALITDAFRRKEASEDSQFVVLFLKPIDSLINLQDRTWISQEVSLRSGEQKLAPLEVNLPTSSAGTGGYFWFRVPKNAKDFSLEFGSESPQTKISLGF